MKNLSMGLNAVLFVAVAVLYFLHFSDKKRNDSKPKMAVSKALDNGGSHAAIAYVELDSLYQNITYIKIKRKELEAEQKSIENEWENGFKVLENKRDNFLKKADAITQEAAQQFQGELMEEKQQLDERRQSRTQVLNEKNYKFMDEVQKKLRDFLTEYNSEKNYMYIFTTGTGLEYMVYKDSSLNITVDVTEGMNKKMNATDKQ